MNRFQNNLIILFEQNENAKPWHKRLDKFLYILIFLSSLGVFLETLPSIQAHQGFYNSLLIFEDMVMIVFAIELLLELSVSRKLYKRCQNSWERFMLFFYIFIDFLAILPAILFAFGSTHHDYFLTLRLLRLFKAFRHDDSVELVLRAIVVKKDILFKTAIIVLIVTVFLSVVLYEAEHKFEIFTSTNIEEKTKFIDLWTSLTWSFSMFVGDLAGYIESGYIPTTPLGKFVAGVLGFMNIAIVVIPTGIIASGFLEVLEEKKIDTQYKVLVEAFRPKYIPSLQTELYERPRTMLTLQNSLYIHQNNLFKIMESKPGFRLRSVQSDDNEKYGDLNLIEFYAYGELTKYGVKKNDEKNEVTVICPEGLAKKGIGYFTYAISALHKSNLVSNEKFELNSLDLSCDVSFVHNSKYFEDIDLHKSKKALKKINPKDIALQTFKNDILTTNTQHYWIFMSDSKESHFTVTSLTENEAQENSFFQWLFHKNLSSYIIRVSQKKLDNYSFYDLIAEVSETLKKV